MVDEKLVEQPKPTIDFDTTTKPEGTLNAKVQQKQKFLADEKAKQKREALLKSLPTLEKDAEQLLKEEIVVIMEQQFLNKLREIYEKSKERGKEHLEETDKTELICSIAEDPYFEEKMNKVVRCSSDGVEETLDTLLNRIMKQYKGEEITFNTFIGFFCRRGRLRDGETAVIKTGNESELLNVDGLSLMSIKTDESAATKEYRLKR